MYRKTIESNSDLRMLYIIHLALKLKASTISGSIIPLIAILLLGYISLASDMSNSIETAIGIAFFDTIAIGIGIAIAKAIF